MTQKSSIQSSSTVKQYIVQTVHSTNCTQLYVVGAISIRIVEFLRHWYCWNHGTKILQLHTNIKARNYAKTHGLRHICFHSEMI